MKEIMKCHDMISKCSQTKRGQDQVHNQALRKARTRPSKVPSRAQGQPQAKLKLGQTKAGPKARPRPSPIPSRTQGQT